MKLTQTLHLELTEEEGKMLKTFLGRLTGTHTAEILGVPWPDCRPTSGLATHLYSLLLQALPDEGSTR